MKTDLPNSFNLALNENKPVEKNLQNSNVARNSDIANTKATENSAIKRLLIIFRFNTSCFTSCQGSPTTGDQPSEYISGRLPRHSQPAAPKPTDIRTESRTRALVLQNNLDAIYGSNIPQLFQPQYNPLTLFWHHYSSVWCRVFSFGSHYPTVFGDQLGHTPG